jgi:protein-tyrosine-phosphatase
LFRHLARNEGLSDVEVFSRGVFAEVDEPMTRESFEALKKVGVSGQGHSAAMLTARDVAQASEIYAMTQDHLEIILQRHPEAKPKARRLAPRDIADPYGRSLSEYEKCRIEIQNALLDIILKFKSEGSPTP